MGEQEKEEIERMRRELIQLRKQVMCQESTGKLSFRATVGNRGSGKAGVGAGIVQLLSVFSRAGSALEGFRVEVCHAECTSHAPKPFFMSRRKANQGSREEQAVCLGRQQEGRSG